MTLPRLSPFFICTLVLSLAFPVQGSVLGERESTAPVAKGGLILYTVPPRTVCVGDTFTVEGGAFISYPDSPPSNSGEIPLHPISSIHINVTTTLGSASPNDIVEIENHTYFNFSYTATAAGNETIRVTENDGLAFDMLKFKVEATCAYDAFLVTVLDFTANAGDFNIHTLTNVSGTGTMKRVTSTTDILQGDGTWNLEENMLSQPPECVQWYMPPLLLSGPFELDGELNSEGDTLSVILAFQPRTGPPVYHGKSICVDADGNEGEGWGFIQSGGDESLIAKIQTDFPTGGGSQQVELTGGGINIVQSVGNMEYTANLTLIRK